MGLYDKTVEWCLKHKKVMIPLTYLVLIGSALLIAFPEVLRSLADYRFVVYGLLLIFMMRFRPQGLLGGLSKRPYDLPKGVLRPKSLSDTEGKQVN